MRVILLVWLALLTSCGGGSTGGEPTPPPAQDVPCTGSYSGAVSGTFSCTVVATYAPGPSGSAFGFTVADLLGSALDVSLPGIVWTGNMAVGTYSETSALVTSDYNLVTGGTRAAPVAYLLMKNWNTNLGAFTLTLDSAVVANGAATPQTYTAHGTFTGTLVQYAGTSTSGSVMVAITF